MFAMGGIFLSYVPLRKLEWNPLQLRTTPPKSMGFFYVPFHILNQQGIFAFLATFLSFFFFFG